MELSLVEKKNATPRNIKATNKSTTIYLTSLFIIIQLANLIIKSLFSYHKIVNEIFNAIFLLY